MKPKIYLKDHVTGEEITRDMTDEEIAALDPTTEEGEPTE